MSRLLGRAGWDELKGDWPIWLLIVAGFAVGIWALPNMPERVPSYWLLRGRIGFYSTPSTAAFFPPTLHFILYVALVIAPLIDPRRENPARVTRAYRGLRLLVVAALSVLYFVYIFGTIGA